jgi:anti-sigma factor RsiW
MRCARVQDRLLLYLAGEVEVQEAARLCRHLERCSRCTAAADELAETQELVEGALRTTARAPLTLDTRVMAAVRREPTRRPSRFGPIPFWSGRQRLTAVTAALSLLMGGYWLGHWHTGGSLPAVARLARPGWSTLPLARLGDDHLEYLANPQPAQIPGPDPRQVSRRLTSLLKYPVAVVDLQHEGARLLGGRKCRVQGVWIAFLLYDWKGERVSLYQIDGRKIAMPPLREIVSRGRCFHVSQIQGLSYVTWRSGAMNFVMVSGASPERLLQLARCASGISENA